LKIESRTAVICGRFDGVRGVGRRAVPVERKSRGNWAAPRGSREAPRRSHDGAPYGSRLVASNGGRGAGSGRL